MWLPERLIARVYDLCRSDRRLDSALMYGSFAQGTADEHSDIEFWLFFAPEQHPTVDPREWCARIAPVTHLVMNEFGTHVVFFPGLVRGEFHFASADDLETVRSWPARGAPVERMIVVDRRGALCAVLESVPERVAAPRDWAEVEPLCGRLANWLVLAHHVLLRGEVFRAVDALGHAQRHLLWLARLDADRTEHWLTPSRRAEVELPPYALDALRGTSARAVPDQVRAAIRTAWRHGRDHWSRLAQRYGQPLPHELFAELDRDL